MDFLINFFKDEWNCAVIIIGISLSIVLWIKGNGSDCLRGYIPTLWTSLGILCTFMAIYYGLSDYSSNAGNDGVSPSDSGNFDINKLIKEVIPAFSTSIIGIIGAIISTIINRWIGDNQEKADYEQFLKIKNKIPGQKLQSSSPEMVLLEIISTIRETSNQTCEKLRNNNDSSGKKLEQIGSGLTKLDTTTSAVGDRIKSAISDCMTKQREDFTSAISLLISTLSSELKSQSDSMAKKMDDLRRMLHDEIRHIESTNQDLLTQLLNLTTQTLIKDSETRNKALQDFVAQHNAGLENTFGEITAGMGALYQKIEESITYHITEERSLFEHEIKDSIEEFANAQYKTCSDTIAICNQELTSNIEQLHQNHVQSCIDIISKIEDVFTHTCGEFRLRMEALSTDLIKKMDEVNDANVSSIAKTVEQNQQIIQLMLDNHSKDVKITADHIIEEESKIHQAFAGEYQMMREKMLEQFNLYLAEIQNAVAATRDQLETDSRNVSTISSEITDTMSALISGVRKSNDDFLTNLGELKKQIVDSTGIMSKDIQNAITNSSQIRQLEATAIKMTSAINETISSLTKEMDRISSVIDCSVEAIKESAEIYSNSVHKSDTVTRYMEGTSQLFKEHNNAISILDKSLMSMVDSITQMRDTLSPQGDRKLNPKSMKK